MAFKLGDEKRGAKTPENQGLFRKDMEDGSRAQANNDGSIDIDPSVDMNSLDGIATMAHEMSHQADMESGRADYGDNWVMWEGKIYLRKEIEGQDIIDGPNGRWPAGDPRHPWEREAIQVEEMTKVALAMEGIEKKHARMPGFTPLKRNKKK